jgi:hypothetical protein
MAGVRNMLGMMLAICVGSLAAVPCARAQVPFDSAAYTKHGDCKVSPGTVITKQNWQQYKDCFSIGEQHLFQGDLFYKMPDDVEIHVGQQHNWTLPKPYVEATEKYGGQTRLVKLPDGHYKMENYVAGLPFPNPSEPEKGTKIAANVTYKMQGYQWGMFQDLGGAPTLFLRDRFGNWSQSILNFTYLQLGYNWEPDVPRTNPQSAGAWYTQWVMQLTPEQSKYTTVLTIFWADNTKDEDDYVFVPALRRSLRLSASARCAPLFGSDAIRDDQRYGWNGGVGKFVGKWLSDQKILTIQTVDIKASYQFPGNYDGELAWPKPILGDWETRDVHIVDIRRAPEFAAGYCYGSRVDYIDKQYYTSIDEDIYDSGLKLWKIYVLNMTSKPLDNYGDQMWMGGIVGGLWDVQNQHETIGTTANPNGVKISWDREFPDRYRDVIRYGTPGGLSQVMR